MNYTDYENTISTLKRLQQEMSDESYRKKFWHDFPKIPIALYDEERVFLTGYAGVLDGFKEQDGVLTGKRDSRFYGNTAIELEGQQVAICYLTTLESSISYGKLLSFIFHEAYHGYQRLKGERRWANELQILEYPFTVENTAIRFLERRELLRALYSSSRMDIRERLASFVGLRERRRIITGDALNYELAQESIEGTALYVETKVYSDYEVMPLAYSIALQSKDMGELEANLEKLRLSCYAPGMCMAFVLDKLDSQWQKDYMNSERYIYDFLRDLAGTKVAEFNVAEIPEEILEKSENAVSRYRKLIDEEFNSFENSGGYRIALLGEFPLKGIDPLNIKWKDRYILSEHFFATEFNRTPVVISGKSRARRTGEGFRFDEIVFYSDSKPVIMEGFVEIPCIGIVKARLEESDRGYDICEEACEPDG